MYIAFVCAAAAGRTEILYVADEPPRFATVIVDTTVEVDDGTV
jgi:hypothetical protein